MTFSPSEWNESLLLDEIGAECDSFARCHLRGQSLHEKRWRKKKMLTPKGEHARKRRIDDDCIVKTFDWSVFLRPNLVKKFLGQKTVVQLTYFQCDTEKPKNANL
jgi:hypothetical protein